MAKIAGQRLAEQIHIKINNIIKKAHPSVKSMLKELAHDTSEFAELIDQYNSRTLFKSGILLIEYERLVNKFDKFLYDTVKDKTHKLINGHYKSLLRMKPFIVKGIQCPKPTK